MPVSLARIVMEELEGEVVRIATINLLCRNIVYLKKAFLSKLRRE
jgi:hypothetical protein